jgi:hypothetical protein
MGHNPEPLIMFYSLVVPVQEIYKSLVKAAAMAMAKIDIIRACQKGGMKGSPPWVPGLELGFSSTK